jgi:dynein heavy chain
MNTVLIQEMERYNKLLAAMYSDLEALMKAIKGFTIMSPALEAISSSLVIGKVPESWTKVSYPSLKPLASYVADFLERIKFLEVRKHVSISVTFSHLVNTVLTTAASREQMTILK